MKHSGIDVNMLLFSFYKKDVFIKKKGYFGTIASLPMKKARNSSQGFYVNKRQSNTSQLNHCEVNFNGLVFLHPC